VEKSRGQIYIDLGGQAPLQIDPDAALDQPAPSVCTVYI
jgi:hypothetical protein